MTVLYFADTRFPIERANGAQTMATCHALAARGHSVTLVVRPDSAAVGRDPFHFYGLAPEPRLRFQTIAGSGFTPWRRVRFLLSAATLAANTPGVVYTRDLGLASFLLRVPRVGGSRIVYESHGVADVVAEELPRLLGPATPRPTRRKLARLARRDARVWRQSAAYVTITRALSDELASRFGPREHVYAVPDGARLTTSPSGEVVVPSTSADTVVGYAGHLYPWKGVDVLIHAVAQLPTVHAVIVGGHPAESDRQRVEALARDLGVASRIMFTGLVPPSEVAGHLASATVLILPNTASAISERYTSPLKLFEYLAMGRAIVASDLPAIREILTHEETALLVPPGDPAALAAAVARLSADPGLATRLGTAAKALAPFYAWERRAERLEAALRAAVA